jgi:hypothetical protein
MVKIRGPVLSFTARGWLGGYFYQTHFVNPFPYPIALLGRIREPYFMPAWGLRPYPSFISQYYSPTGWIYEMRRTWHGIQPTARRAQWPIKQAVDRGDPYQKRYADAVSIWQGMSQEVKDIYNKLKFPPRCSGYNKWIKFYIENTVLTPTVGNYILIEDGDYFLQEDGSLILQQ